MKNSIAVLSFFFVALIGFGQDIHFTQMTQTPLLINPASAGVFDGWERVNINHRNQWLGASTQFMTTNVSADMNLFKSDRKNKAHMGLGILLYNDVGGDSQFGQRQASITVSGILPMGQTGHTFSAGIQGGIANRSGNASALSFRNQWDGEKFNSTYLSGEQNKLAGFSYIDASAGLYYVYDGAKTGFRRKSDFKFQLGFSGYHLNAPKFKFNNGGVGEQLLRKYVGHAGIIKDLGDSKMALDANVVQTIQGSHMETLLGLMLRYRFVNGTLITGNSQNAFFGIGLYTRLNDAIMPSVLIDYKGFQFGISYDVTLSALRKAYRGGSLEFSLSYVNRNHALFKSRRARF